jgi:hypothetical protein
VVGRGCWHVSDDDTKGSHAAAHQLSGTSRPATAELGAHHASRCSPITGRVLSVVPTIEWSCRISEPEADGDKYARRLSSVMRQVLVPSGACRCHVIGDR